MLDLMLDFLKRFSWIKSKKTEPTILERYSVSKEVFAVIESYNRNSNDWRIEPCFSGHRLTHTSGVTLRISDWDVDNTDIDNFEVSFGRWVYPTRDTYLNPHEVYLISKIVRDVLEKEKSFKEAYFKEILESTLSPKQLSFKFE